MASPPPPDVFTENPYSNHTSLSPVEKEVLWEYAKLAQNLQLLKEQTRDLSEQPGTVLMSRLRAVENKMGLILTLFKASVWGVINEQTVGDGSSPNNTNFDDNTFRP
ncbi:DASH complex subunit Dad3-domain-containing protein [Mycena polygramma]|nr:DASH complex subunit Dad3-domain-containing protein [Mycena polygramma]